MSTEHPILTNLLALADQSTWQRTITLADETLDAWLAGFAAAQVSRIYFVGCGTSYYAGQVAKYATEHIAHIPVEAAQAFAFATYAAPAVLGPEVLVVGISTTGESEAVVDALAHAHACGALTLAVTANPGSSVTQTAQATLLTGGEDDKVSVKTKSYVQSLVVLYALAERLARARGVQNSINWRQQIEAAAQAVAAFLSEMQPAVEELADHYRAASKVFVLGTGPNNGTVEEASLKVIEMAKMYSEAQELEDFLHGRFREVDQVNPMFFVAPHGRASSRTLDFLTATSQVGVPTVVLTDTITPGIKQLATQVIKMPEGLDELITPLLYIVPLHLFAYHIALRRGYDPASRRYNIVPQKVRYGDLASV